MQIPHGKFEVLDSFWGLFFAFGGPFTIKHAVFDNGEQFKPEILKEISLNLGCYNLHGIVLSRF